MQKITLLLCAVAAIALLGGCAPADDGAPMDPNAAQATSGGAADPASNAVTPPSGAQTAPGANDTTNAEAGLNPNLKPPAPR